MTAHLGKVLISFLILGLVMMCCCLWTPFPPRVANPPETFNEEELVGVWKADYSHYRCVESEVTKQVSSLAEWLVLRGDKTFYQVLQDRRGKIPDQRAQGTWWVERFPDGAMRLHLEGGRFFAAAVCDSFPFPPLTGGIGYYSYSSDQTGHELSFFGEHKAVLIVGWDTFRRRLYLEYPYIGDPDAPVIVEFQRVPESEATTVPPPEP